MLGEKDEIFGSIVGTHISEVLIAAADMAWSWGTDVATTDVSNTAPLHELAGR
jgi:hypothetical protein